MASVIDVTAKKEGIGRKIHAKTAKVDINVSWFYII